MSVAPLAPHKLQLLELLVRSGILTFGQFTTKSGRATPYFINTGNFCTGAQLEQLGELYAAELVARFGDGFDNLYGPAYKGIPLAVATTMALYRRHGRTVSYTFNRKEAKDHGEGGSLVGHRYRTGDRVIIIEDVITAGTSIGESVPLLLKAAAVQLVGVVVAVDRQERGTTPRTALAEVTALYGFPAHAIVTLDDIVAGLHGRAIDGKVVLTDEVLVRINAYRALYGAAG